MFINGTILSMNSKLISFIKGMSIGLQNMQTCLFIKDIDSRYAQFSQYFEHKLGINVKSVIGNTDYHMPWESYADQYRQRDTLARENSSSDFFEPIPLEPNKIIASRCIRSAIQDEDDEIIGVIGQVEIFSIHTDLAQALQALMKINQQTKGLPNHVNSSYQILEYPQALQFTSRESECLFLLLHGKTAKEIGVFLNISSRTVETYIEHIKIKLNVSKRSEIVAKALELGIVDIIPKQSILSSLYKYPTKWKHCLD